MATLRLFRISRSGSQGTARRPELFEVAVDARTTVLDALFAIQRDRDPSLSFRCSCRVGMCGTCAVSVNRMPTLACKTRVEDLPSGTVTVEPLPQLPVFKDLIVSLAPFFEQWKRSLPALHPLDGNSKELARIPPDSEFGREARAKRDCITCGACFSACSIVGSNSRYLGPAAINRAFLRLLDPRDKAVSERLQVINEESGGVWRCHTQFNCVAACPKGIDLTDSIGRLKRAMLRPQKFHEKIRRANRAQV